MTTGTTQTTSVVHHFMPYIKVVRVVPVQLGQPQWTSNPQWVHYFIPYIKVVRVVPVFNEHPDLGPFWHQLIMHINEV